MQPRQRARKCGSIHEASPTTRVTRRRRKENPQADAPSRCAEQVRRTGNPAVSVRLRPEALRPRLATGLLLLVSGCDCSNARRPRGSIAIRPALRAGCKCLREATCGFGYKDIVALCHERALRRARASFDRRAVAQAQRRIVASQPGSIDPRRKVTPEAARKSGVSAPFGKLRLQRCRSFSWSSSPRTRAWPPRDHCRSLRR